MTGGGLEYVGGETRLISLASTCNFAELSAALDRVTGSLTIHSGQSIASGSDSVSLHWPGQSDIVMQSNGRVQGSLPPLVDLRAETSGVNGP